MTRVHVAEVAPALRSEVDFVCGWLDDTPPDVVPAGQFCGPQVTARGQRGRAESRWPVGDGRDEGPAVLRAARDLDDVADLQAGDQPPLRGVAEPVGQAAASPLNGFPRRAADGSM